MLKSDEIMSPSSCLNKAASDEQVFVLREKDPLFVECLRHWAHMAHGIHEPAKIQEAVDTAYAAEMKRRFNGYPR